MKVDIGNGEFVNAAGELKAIEQAAERLHSKIPAMAKVMAPDLVSEAVDLKNNITLLREQLDAAEVNRSKE